MKPRPGSDSAGTNSLKLFLKMAIIIASFWYISGKINWNQAWGSILHSKGIWLLPAFIFFILSKLIAAIRLNLYFNNTGLTLTRNQNLKLYWLGMFYNLFLPGSVGGDAYKVILLKKKYEAPYKKTTSAVLLDRFSGLLGLLWILAGFSVFIFPDAFIPVLFFAGAFTGLSALYFVLKKWWPDFRKSFWPAFFLGLTVQGLQVACAFFIGKALGNHLNEIQYVFIFLVSSFVSVLPLTIGGLGIREVVFLEGAGWFGLSRELSVSISLLFYLVTLVGSAPGVYYVFSDPLKKKGPVKAL